MPAVALLPVLYASVGVTKARAFAGTYARGIIGEFFGVVWQNACLAIDSTCKINSPTLGQRSSVRRKWSVSYHEV